MSRFKFTVFDKETAKDIKQLLKTNKKKYMQKEKTDEVLDLDKKTEEPDTIEPTEPIDVPKPKKRGRAKLTKEQKQDRKKKRTPEQQEKINERMKKLRELRKKKKESK